MSNTAIKVDLAVIWETKDGRLLKLGDMSINHLQNVRKMLSKQISSIQNGLYWGDGELAQAGLGVGTAYSYISSIDNVIKYKTKSI